MTEPEMNWPKKGDQAFKPLGSPTIRATLEAFILPPEGLYLVGFRRAADMIVEAAQKGRQNTGHLFFPVAYLYRHHLELWLKELVRIGEGMEALANVKSILGGHDLVALWNKVKELIEAFFPVSADDARDAVEHVIREFNKWDPKGEAFRYSHDKKGKPHLQDLPARVNLLKLKDTVDAVSWYLDATYAGMESCDPGDL